MEGSRVKVGVIHGRFQLLHLGHLEYLLAAKKRCEYLYIGISNPDPLFSKPNSVSPERSLATNNPFKYYERLEMIKGALLDEGVQRSEFEFVPFPIGFPQSLSSFVPMDATFYLTIYDKWGEEKLRLFKELGLNVEIMWRKELADKLTSATTVRELIKADKQWENLVPRSTADYLKRNNLIERIKEVS